MGNTLLNRWIKIKTCKNNGSFKLKVAKVTFMDGSATKLQLYFELRRCFKARQNNSYCKINSFKQRRELMHNDGY